jgi:hypothetical protein
MEFDEYGQIARERLAMLCRWIEEIVTAPHKPRRAKDIELAGVKGMIAQIEAEQCVGRKTDD